MQTSNLIKHIGLYLFLVQAPLWGLSFSDVSLQESSLNETPELLRQSAYSGIGAVTIAEGSVKFRGTGVLVAKDWVLTAAHNWQADAVTGLSFNWNGQTFAANPYAWQQHPGWLASPEVGLTQGRDLALFQISEPVPGATPARLYSGKPALGTELTFFGAGLTGNGGSLQANPDATLYTGTNNLERILLMDSPDGSGGLLAFDFDDGNSFHNSLATSGVADVNGSFITTMPGMTVTGNTSSDSLTSLEATSAPGDSGGPAFLDNGNGPELIGLISWGVNPTNPANPYGSGLGDITYLTDLTHHRGWINSVIPEPSSLAHIIGVISLLLTHFHRRKI